MTSAGRLLLSGAILALVAWGSTARAAQDPLAGALDERIRFIDYVPYQVTRIAGTLWSSTQLEFAADEDIQHVGIGNSIAWDIAVKGNFLFLKPRELQGPTNMHVITKRPDGSQRSYQIEIVAMSKEFMEAHKQLKPFYLVKFRYPADDAAKAKAAKSANAEIDNAAQAERTLTALELAGPNNHAYTAQGEAYFEPTAVSDNGKLTTFEFAGNIEIPAIFLGKDDGSETLVAKSVRGHSVIVHAMGAKFVLRRGFEVICIFNEDYHPEGFDPGTNTVSSRVARVVKTPSAVKSAKGSAVGVSPAAGPTAIAPAQPVNTQPLFAPAAQGLGQPGAKP